MVLEPKIYITSDFREADTKSKKQEYEIIITSRMILTLVLTNDIYNKIAEMLSKAKMVDKIFIVREENTFCIWTSLCRYDKNSRYALYNQELEIIRYFSPVEFHFDFHLAEPDDVEELISSGAKMIYPSPQR